MIDDGDHIEGSPEVAAPFESLLKNALGALEPSSVAAFGALLTLVHASNVVTASPHPSEPRASEKNNHAVQAAAAALGQLSQQGPSDRPSLAFDNSAILQDQVRQNVHIVTHTKTCQLYRSRAPGLLRSSPSHQHWLIYKMFSQTSTLSLIFWTITSGHLQYTGYGLLFMGQALTASIWPYDLDHTNLLLISMRSLPYSVYVHCNFCLTLTIL